MAETGFGPHKFGIDMVGHTSGFDGVDPLSYGPILRPLGDLLHGQTPNFTEGFNDLAQSLKGGGRTYDVGETGKWWVDKDVVKYTITEHGANESYRATSIYIDKDGDIRGTSYKRFNAITGEEVTYDEPLIETAFGYNNDGGIDFYTGQLRDFLREFQAATGEKIIVNSIPVSTDFGVKRLPYVFDEPAIVTPNTPIQDQALNFIKNGL